jgi:hypothetical protein
MSGSSDSEEFYDAEDLTPNRSSRKNKTSREVLVISRTESDDSVSIKEKEPEVKPAVEDACTDHPQGAHKCIVPPLDKNETVDVEKKITGNHGRRRFQELRQRMQTDDEDTGLNNTSPPDSQTSSVEGVFAVPSKTSHPFRIIEHDALSLQSMTSLGRVGRILGGSIDNTVSSTGRDSVTLLPPAVLPTTSGGKDDDSLPETSSSTSQSSHNLSPDSAIAPTQKCSNNDREETSKLLHLVNKHEESRSSLVSIPLQEPDVIASTKNANNSNSINGMSFDGGVESPVPVPVAPPRRKKKSKPQTPRSLTPPPPEEVYPQSSPLPSPASTIESLTREFEHSLDIRSATKGQYVVKPQDEDRAKAEGPSSEELKRLDRLKAELLSANSSQTSGSPVGSISSNSIGRTNGGTRKKGLSPRGSKERRRSAGDEQGMMSQLNMFVRTRTDSGKQLSDLEILEQVTVLNLDTGERVPLSIAEDKLPQCINPLSLHIMRLTSEYVSNSSLEKGEKESDEESVDSKKLDVPPGEEVDGNKMSRAAQLKKMFGSKLKKTMNKAKSIAQEVSHARHKEDVMDIVDDVYPEEQYIKLKASGSHKGPYEFDSLQHVQDLGGEHVGPVWCMKFSSCGRLLATAGQDRVLRVWVVRNAFTYFQVGVFGIALYNLS